MISLAAASPSNETEQLADYFSAHARHEDDPAIVLNAAASEAFHLGVRGSSIKAALMDYKSFVQRPDVKREIDGLNAYDVKAINSEVGIAEWAAKFPLLHEILHDFTRTGRLFLDEIIIHTGGDYERQFGGTYHIDHDNRRGQTCVHFAINLGGAGMNYLVGLLAHDDVRAMNRMPLKQEILGEEIDLSIRARKHVHQQRTIRKAGLRECALELGQGVAFPSSESGHNFFHGAPSIDAVIESGEPRRFLSGRFRYRR